MLNVGTAARHASPITSVPTYSVEGQFRDLASSPGLKAFLSSGVAAGRPTMGTPRAQTSDPVPVRVSTRSWAPPEPSTPPPHARIGSKLRTVAPTNYRHKAQTLGVSVEYGCLQALRKGTGLNSAERLLDLPASLREPLGLGGSPSLPDLKAAVAKLLHVVAELPNEDQLIAAVTWKLKREPGVATIAAIDPLDDWLDRCQKAALNSTLPWTDESSIRRQSDRVIFEVLLRLLDSAGPDLDSDTTGSAEGIGPTVSRASLLESSETGRTPARTSAGLASGVGASGRSLASEFFSEPYIDNSTRFRDAIRSAASVSLLGFSHNRMAVTYAEPLGRILASGGSLKVLMLDPSSPAIFDANERSYAPKAKRDVKHQHQAAAATFAAIGSRAKAGCFEVRLMDRLPPFTIYLFDENDPVLGQAFVWLTPWRRPSGERPGFHLQAHRDAEWYNFFTKQVHDLWDHYDSVR